MRLEDAMGILGALGAVYFLGVFEEEPLRMLEVRWCIGSVGGCERWVLGKGLYTES